jgi:hypothetical protein
MCDALDATPAEEVGLSIVDRHLLVHLDGRLALVDTGAPFDIGRGRATVLLGEAWTPPTDHARFLDVAEEHVGVAVEWLIGHPTLSRCRLLLDWLGRRARFARGALPLPGATARPIDLGLPVPRIEIVVAGDPDTRVLAVLDSGAALSYAPTSATAGRVPVRCERDFHPMVGAYETDVFAIPIQIGERSLVIEAGHLPPELHALAHVGGGWILGSDFFRDRTIVLDYAGRVVLDAPGAG